MKNKFTAPQQLEAKNRLAMLSDENASSQMVSGLISVALNKVREQIHQHRVHEVYSVTILQEMVLHGTGRAFEYGPALVPAAELEATAPLWSGVPILVNHPDDGWSLGNEQYIMNESGLGFLADPWFYDGKLTAELWIDQEVAEKNERWIDIKMQAENGTLELSTGYLLIQNEKKDGTLKGDAYNSIHKGIIPLHLALLPEATGACSVASGCGMNTESKDDQMSMITKAVSKFTAFMEKFEKETAAPAAINKQEKEGQKMTPEQIKLVAALQKAIPSLDLEKANKLVGNCDCAELAAEVSLGLDDLVEKAENASTLETTLKTVKAELKVFTDAEAAEAEKKRPTYLEALNMSDESPGVKDISTETLKTMVEGKAAENTEHSTDLKKAANLAVGDEKKVDAKPAPASTLPKAK